MYKKIIAVIVFFTSTFVLFSQKSTDEFYRLIGEKNFEAAQQMIQQVSSEHPKDYKLQTACGDVLYELEKFKEAVVYYSKAYEIEDDDQMVSRKYAMGLAEAGDINKALKIIKQTIKNNPKVVDNYLTASEIYIKADSLSEAEIQIDRAMGIDPKNPAIFVASGNFYFARRVYELARDNYEKAIMLDSTIVEAHLKLATSYYWLATRELDRDLGNELFTRSLKEWNIVSRLDSMNAKAFFEQGKIWFFAERYNEAVNPLSRYIKLRPTGSSLGRWYLAQSLYNLGEWESAIPNLEQSALEIDSIKTTAKQYLADCYLATKNYEMANKTYQELASSMEFTSTDYRKYGQAAFFVKDTLNAIANFKKAIDMDKDNNCALMFSVGTLLSSMKDYEGSIQMLKLRLETAACQDSTNIKANYVIGTNYLFSSKPDSAIIYLDKAISMDPKNIFAEIYLGDALIQLTKVKEGVEKYKNVLSKFEGDPSLNPNGIIQAFAKLSNYYLDQKNYTELNKVAKRWTDTYPDNSFGFLYLAVSYQGQGDKENACRNYSKVLKLDPNNTTAKKNRELMGCGQ